MNKEYKKYEMNFRGRDIIVEINLMAKQANGNALIRYGETVVLTTAVMSKNKVNLDFFPLMVIYQEKLYSVGKIPGGFIKREGRPSENATLTSRLIDRPLRPLFDESLRNEVQIINTILSVDQDNSPDMMALFGSSLSLSTSDIPFGGPVAGVIVGRVNNEFVINPTASQIEESDLYLTVAGTYEAINMVEASCDEVSEEDMLEAIMFGHEAIKELIVFQEEIARDLDIAKREVDVFALDNELNDKVLDYALDKMKAAIKIKEKLARNDAIAQVLVDTLSNFSEASEEEIKQIKYIVHELEKNEFRRLITEEKIRPDGRRLDEIRPLNSMIDLLPRTHGSAMFTRGQTQALSITTLGALGEHQILDGLEIEESKRFMLHYNFPLYSVGETGRYGAPSRREIGHGALGEKALSRIIPSEEEFPYTIRVVSEILESNGSTSQASICAGCMSLMAAGVPIKNMIAGIAMGLITNGVNYDEYSILTDIQGMEDHLGDMDFKVAGTKNGICALQMDIKIKGITKEILQEALEQAKIGRYEILEHMETVISKPKEVLSKYAPKIKQITINPAKIKDVIGRGGETITRIILEASNVSTVNDVNAVKVDLEDDGRVIVYHKDYEIIEKTVNLIKEVIREVEENKIYTGVVTKVVEFGCVVELWPGCDGMVHISHLDEKRVEKVTDIVDVGDDILVKAIGYDKKGRLNLSRKLAIKKDE